MGWESSGGAGAALLDEVIDESTAVDSTTSQIPADSSEPQISEGKEIYSVTISPKEIGSILEIELMLLFGRSAGGNITAAIFDGSTDSIAAHSIRVESTGTMSCLVKKRYIATSTDPLTITARYGPNTGATAFVNANTSGTQRMGAAADSYLWVRELKDPNA